MTNVTWLFPSSAPFPLQTLGKEGVGNLGLNSFGDSRDELDADEMFRDQISHTRIIICCCFIEILGERQYTFLKGENKSSSGLG